MSSEKRIFPFNAEQTVNILSEFGPLVTMFVVNAAYGIEAGTYALIGTTILAIAAMFYMFHRPPFFPLIASSVTIAFGALTLYTHDPMWVQIKVTIFNLMFAGLLFGGLKADNGVCSRISARSVAMSFVALLAGQTAQFALSGERLIGDEQMMQKIVSSTGFICAAALVIGYFIGSLLLRKNFFQYVFEKTFHYTPEGWDRFTFSFAWFFVVTALANELVRLTFKDTYTYDVFGHMMTGVNIWILFKIALVMPASGLYAWFLTRLMHKYRVHEPHHAQAATSSVAPAMAPASMTRPVGAVIEARAPSHDHHAGDHPGTRHH